MKTKGILISALIIFLLIFATALLVPYGEDGERELVSYDYSQIEANTNKNKEDIILTLKDKEDLEYKRSFNIVEPGEYYIEAQYLPKEGNGRDIQFNIYIDGVNIAKQSGISSLSRFFVSSPEFMQTLAGDEVRPEQSEIFARSREAFKDNSKSRVKIFLEAGQHNLEIINVKEECDIDTIYLRPAKSRTYEEYVESLPNKDEARDYMSHIEAERPYLKSVADLYPIYDRSSPYTTPYNPTDLRYNTIGGQNWSDEGQWIEWLIDVPKDDYYQIGLRYRQNLNKGVESLRRIEIDGEVLFDDLEELPFDYSVNWQQKFLGDDDPFAFYLTEGEHRIRMEVSLGQLSEIIPQMNDTIYDLNALYRKIIMITGTVPDIYRDYNLDVAIPDLMESFNTIRIQLEGYEEYLANRYGEKNYSSRVISQMARQIDGFIKKPYIIQKNLSVFKTNISAAAEWVLSFEEQPLEIDSFYITGVGMELPKVETNLLGKIGHEMRSFAGSFFRDYSNIGSIDQNEDMPTITVWVNKGRDQANVIKRLIDNNFTKETGIGVNINLVQGALVKAAIAGKGPDVNLFTTRGEAMNLAFRGALLPLDEFEEFEGLTKDYMENAFVPYEYDEKFYGIPEEQVFYTMFVRTDILNSLSIDYPKTWDDLMNIMPVLQGENLEIGLPYTDGYATMNSGIGTINLLPTLLAQRGIGIYNDDNTKIVLDSSEAYEAFKMWSDFYTMYDFPLYKDDFNRFRTGEMPIIVAPYTLYNNLRKAAPEISGQWKMVNLPGTKNENGEIDISTSASGSCSIILEDSRNKEAAWEFVKWWNSSETQGLFSKEIESELSILGRYTPANIKAFDQTNWYEDEKEILLRQWESVVEIPEVTGGYYVSRNIDNAFRAVYYNSENPRENLYYWMNMVNEELLRKQTQVNARKEGQDGGKNERFIK